MASLYPPLHIKVVDEEGQINKTWEGFFLDVYQTMGQRTSPYFFDKDTIKPDAASTDLNIGTTNQQVYLNDIHWTPTLVNGDLAVVDANGDISYLDPTVVFLSDEAGDLKWTYKTAADSGWILMNDGTIGDAGSGASTRANADTIDLYKILWDNCTDAACPVSTGRGASAQADFDAGKTINLPLIRGRGLLNSITASDLATTRGAETHVLTAGQTPPHGHGNPLGADSPTSTHSGTRTSAAWDNSLEVTFSSVGGGAAHNNMQPFGVLRLMIKL